MEEKRWTADDRNVFDPNGEWHCTSDNAGVLAARLNADMQMGIKQIWMPGVNCFEDEDC